MWIRKEHQGQKRGSAMEIRKSLSPLFNSTDPSPPVENFINKGSHVLVYAVRMPPVSTSAVPFNILTPYQAFIRETVN